MRLCNTVLVATLVAVLISPANAGEELVEGLAGRTKFASAWAEGTVELGGDKAFPWARITTTGKGDATFVSNVRSYRPSFDFSDKFVKVWLRVSDVEQLGGLELRLSSDRFASNYFAFSLPRYDDLDFNYLRDGVWAPVTFSFGGANVEGDPDRAAITGIGWYVADKGGDRPIQVDWAGLASVDLPSEGLLSFTFDDGYDEQLLAAKVMAEQGFSGTAYVIPESVGSSGYLSLHQLAEMSERYGWEIAAHHQTPFTDLDPAQLELEILSVQRFLLDNQFSVGAGHLAYPLGRQNDEVVRPLVRKYFTTARIAASGPETLPPADPHLLRVFNVTNETTPEQVGAAASRARAHKEWLILMLHYLVEKPTNHLEYGIEDFTKLVAAVKESGIHVAPVAQVWNACGDAVPGSCRVSYPASAGAPQRIGE